MLASREDENYRRFTLSEHAHYGSLLGYLRGAEVAGDCGGPVVWTGTGKN
jgi:hypothetical protein